MFFSASGQRFIDSGGELSGCASLRRTLRCEVLLHSWKLLFKMRTQVL